MEISIDKRIENIIKMDEENNVKIQQLKALIELQEMVSAGNQLESDITSFLDTLEYELKASIERASESYDIVQLVKEEARAYQLCKVLYQYSIEFDSCDITINKILNNFFYRRRNELGEYIKVEKL